MKSFFRRAALAIALVTPAMQAGAQMTYTFNQSTAAYTPLPLTASSLTHGQVWDESTVFSAPLGFSFKLDGKTISRFYMTGAEGLLSDSTGVVSGFSFLGGYNVDRGYYDGVAKSPVRYSTTGTAPNRIFKLEMRNLGFGDEDILYNSMNDSANIQIWLYETSNVLELHYGASNLVHFADYFTVGPVIGLGKNLNLSNQSFDKVYLLNGNPLNPSLDSISLSSFHKGLTSMPADGTVYRFTPKRNTLAVSNTEFQSAISVYPTQTSGALTIESKLPEGVEYEVISPIGSLLLSGTVQGGSHQVDLSGLAAGTYLLRLNGSEAQDVRRIVKL